MIQNIKVITGEVMYGRCGHLEDCSQGIYVGTDKINYTFSENVGKTININIEEVRE